MTQPSTIMPAPRNFAVTSAVDIARSCAAVSTPASFAALTPASSACARVRMGGEIPRPIHAPLCEIARWNNPFASGEVTSEAIAIAPADWPNTVTLPGSPPNWAGGGPTSRSWSSRGAARRTGFRASRSTSPTSRASTGWPTHPIRAGCHGFGPNPGARATACDTGSGRTRGTRPLSKSRRDPASFNTRGRSKGLRRAFRIATGWGIWDNRRPARRARPLVLNRPHPPSAGKT